MVSNRIDNNYQNLQRLYGGKHVAIVTGEVVASDESFDELLRLLAEKQIKVDSVCFEYVEPRDVACQY